MPSTYAVSLVLQGRTCVVVGAGDVGERKIDALLESGAEVVVIGPDATPDVRAWARDGRIAWTDREYAAGDLHGAFLAIAATDDREVNKRIAEEASERRVLLNVVDDPELCMFTAPALLKRGDLTVAISTNGKSPAMARKVREDLEARFPQDYGDLVEAAAEARAALREEGRHVTSDVWNAALGPVIDQFAGDGSGAEAKGALLRLLRAGADTDHKERP